MVKARGRHWLGGRIAQVDSTKYKRVCSAFCAVHVVGGGAAVRARDDVGVGVRVQERVVDGLVRVRCVAAQRVRLAGERVVERGCRSGVMGQR